MWALDRLYLRVRLVVCDREAVFLLVLDFFVVDLSALLVDEADCSAERAGDCAANQGTNSNSDSTPARQRALRRAEKIKGTTSIMFSLYAHFA